MPTTPFVHVTHRDEPRQAQNLAPGVHLPPPRRWRPGRPGELGARQPRGDLLGTPGPNVGYAWTLAERRRGDLALAPHEHADDGVAVVAELAAKRASVMGRAPVPDDVEFALELLGYTGEALEAVRDWRPELVRGAAEDWALRREVVDRVPAGLLRLPLRELPEHLVKVREAMARTLQPG